MRSRTLMTLMVVVVLLTMTSLSQAQDPPPVPDPIAQLRLTPEQRQRIRMIAEENKDERQMTNRRLREANIALDQALDADPINESVIDQRVNELSAAQAAQLRMRIQTELKIRRELRPEQLAILRSLHLQIRDVMNAQRPNNQRPDGPGARPNRRGDAFRRP